MKFINLEIFFLATPCGIQDLRSLSMEGTHALCTRSGVLITGPPGKSATCFLTLLSLKKTCTHPQLGEWVIYECILQTTDTYVHKPLDWVLQGGSWLQPSRSPRVTWPPHWEALGWRAGHYPSAWRHCRDLSLLCLKCLPFQFYCPCN